MTAATISTAFVTLFPTANNMVVRFNEAIPLFSFPTDELWTNLIENLDGTKYSCTLSQSTTTLSRSLFTLGVGASHFITVLAGISDSTWNGCELFKANIDKSTTKAHGRSFFSANSSGGRNWIEIHIYDNTVDWDAVTHRPIIVYPSDITDLIS